MLVKKHVVGAGLTALTGIIVLCVGLMWLAGQASPLVLSATAGLIVLGAITGALVPGILLTWLLIGLLTVSSSILLVGYVAMAGWQKVLLLAAYPLMAVAMALARHVIGGWGWLDRNRQAVDRFVTHYDSNLKLQTRHNAAKLYRKEAGFISREKSPALLINVTLIHWAHCSQFRQFQEAKYREHLREISQVLKEVRFPSEQLYYLKDANFLIISYAMEPGVFADKNAATKAALREIGGAHQLQFKWGQVQVNRQNVAELQNLDQVLRRLTRQMETDLVVEYMKEAPING